MKKHIWKKSFSISFIFHIVAVITIGAMVAGFHQEIQRPKEELITVNLADTPEQIAKAQEKIPFGQFSQEMGNFFNHNSDNDNQNIKKEDNNIKNSEEDIKSIDNLENNQVKTNEISAEDGILPATDSGSIVEKTQTMSESFGRGNNENFSSGASSGSESSGNGEGTSISEGMIKSNSSSFSEDRYSVASRFAKAVEANKSYPYSAIRLNQQGTVVVNVTIDASGNLINANVVHSVNSNLDKAALNAVYSACPFSHGLGESISMDVPVNFYLN